MSHTFDIIASQRLALQNHVIRTLRSIGLTVLNVSQDTRMTIEIAPVEKPLHYAKLVSHSGIVSRRDAHSDDIEYSALVEQVRVVWHGKRVAA